MTQQTKIEAATLASAMASAFAEIEGATKSAENPAFKQGGKAIKYADLTSVIEAIKPALIKHGLFFTQRPQPSEGGVTIATVLHHAKGEAMGLGELFVPANRNDAQAFGSALTYARRYALVTAFGVPTEDDDGNAASRSGVGDNASARSAPALTLNAEQVTKLQMLIKAVGSDEITELRKLNAPAGKRLCDMSVAKFEKAVADMEDRLAAMAKGASNTQATDFGELLDDEVPY